MPTDRSTNLLVAAAHLCSAAQRGDYIDSAAAEVRRELAIIADRPRDRALAMCADFIQYGEVTVDNTYTGLGYLCRHVVTYSEPTEEGHMSGRIVAWADIDPDASDTVWNVEHSSESRDCDGRMSHYAEYRIVGGLPTVTVDSSQRDHSAESMGY